MQYNTIIIHVPKEMQYTNMYHYRTYKYLSNITEKALNYDTISRINLSKVSPDCLLEMDIIFTQ